MHRSQILTILLCSFLIGVGIGSTWRYIYETQLLILIGVSLLILAVSAYHGTFGTTTRGITRRRTGFLIGVCLLFIAFGIFYYQRFDSERNQLTRFNDVIVGGKGVPITVRGYVDGPLIDRGSQTQFPFLVKEIVALNRRIPADEKILVTTQGAADYRYGDFLRLTGPVQTPSNLGEFDYRAFLNRQGIRSTMYAPNIEIDMFELPWYEYGIRNLYRNLEDIRLSFERSLQNILPEPHASYLAGILIGTRENIPDRLREAFQRTGTSHILAISGYNIAIVAQGILAVLFFWFPRKRAFWIMAGCIILFVILTGASASVVRAAVMGLLFLFATGYGRLYDAKVSIIMAATLMVLFNPFLLVFDVGFQLSFLAVIGLIYAYPILKNSFKKIPDAFGLRDIALMTLAAQIVTLPLIIGYFKSIPLISLLVNVLILPLVPVAMFAGFFAGLLGMVFIPLGKITGIVAWAISSYQLWIIEFFSRWKFASIPVSVSWVIILLIYMIIAGIFLRAHKKHELA